MKTQAILPTAGSGTRLKTQAPKPLVELNGKPICVYALEAFERCACIDSIILVGSKEILPVLKTIQKRYGLKKIRKIVCGGDTRRQSVANGIAQLDEDTDLVVIHDGVRPLVTSGMISEAVEQCGKWDAVVTGVPLKPTIKRIAIRDLTVKETLDRDTIWEIQTPQVFKKRVLCDAHRRNVKLESTDDAVLVEKIGVRVKVILGSYSNIKITTQEDLIVARAFLEKVNKKPKAGLL